MLFADEEDHLPVLTGDGLTAGDSFIRPPTQRVGSMFWIPLTYLLLSTLTPGPVTVMTVHNTVRYGRSAGMAVALGGTVTTAFFVATSLLLIHTRMVGLPVHTTYQQVGALFILLLALLSAYKVLFARGTQAVTAAQSGRQINSFFAGMGLMAPYLPHAVLFYTVILPEHALSGGLVSTILLWGSVKIGLTLGWYALLAQGAQSIQAWFYNARAQRVLELMAACFLLVISITMLVG